MGKNVHRALRKAALGGSIGPVPKSHKITGEFRDPSERPHGQPWLRPWYMSPRKTEEAAGTRREDTRPPIVPRVHSIARAMADGGPVAGDELGSDPIELERLRVMNRGTTDPATMAANAETNRAFVLDNTPVVGSVRSAARAFDAGSDLITAKHYGHTGKARRAALTLALETAGALSPLPWGRSAGRAAAAGKDTANVLIPARESKGTVLAREMRAEGVPLDTIHRKTSRVIGPEGAVKYEINDQGMRLRPDLRAGDELPLNKALIHPELFAAEPGLGKRMVRVTDNYDRAGMPVSRTDVDGNLEINPAGDPRGQLAKLLQYEINRDAGYGQPLRHGATALERGLDRAREQADRLDAPNRDVIDAYLDQLADVRDAYDLRRSLEQFQKKGPISDAVLRSVHRNAGNLEGRVAAARATATPEDLRLWPYRRNAIPHTGRGPAFDDIFSLPPDDLTDPQMLEFIRRWGQFGSGRGKFARGGRVKRKALAKTARLTLGGVRGKTGGRADKLPVDVPAGAYVIPADVVAALGDGNTEAGMARLDRQFPAARGYAAGGRAEAVPIQISDGEFVVSPAAVAALGGGDEGYGHEVLDEFVTQTRAVYADHLQNLPGPQR